MKKIPTIFVRNKENMREILDEIHQDCEWVFDGEGVATRKYDGTCCLIRNGRLYKRRELKKDASIPWGFEFIAKDEATGKNIGWIPVIGSKEDRWHREAYLDDDRIKLWFSDGTYELCGPKIQGNPEGLEKNTLIAHADAEKYGDILRTFQGIRDFLESKDIEGLVFHHPDGRMGKIKKRDYQLKRINFEKSS